MTDWKIDSGFGFIRPNNGSYEKLFFHINDTEFIGKFKCQAFKSGVKVSYLSYTSHKTNPYAKQVRIEKEDDECAACHNKID